MKIEDIINKFALKGSTIEIKENNSLYGNKYICAENLCARNQKEAHFFD